MVDRLYSTSKAGEVLGGLHLRELIELVKDGKLNAVWMEVRGERQLFFRASALRGVTYFVQAGEDGPVKIGRTRKLKKRLRQIQGNCPVPVRCLGVLKGDCELMMHVRFRRLRLHGEWFSPGPDLMEFIGTLAAPEEAICLKQ